MHRTCYQRVQNLVLVFLLAVTALCLADISDSEGQPRSKDHRIDASAPFQLPLLGTSGNRLLGDALSCIQTASVSHESDKHSDVGRSGAAILQPHQGQTAPLAAVPLALHAEVAHGEDAQNFPLSTAKAHKSQKHGRWHYVPSILRLPNVISLLFVVVIIPVITAVTMLLSTNHCTVTFVVVMCWIACGLMYAFDSVDRRTWVVDKLFSIQKLIANDAYQLESFDGRHWIFFASLVMIAFLNLTITIPMLITFFQRRSLWRRQTNDETSMPALEVSAIVPCYLPNEKDIIEDTVKHILENVKSPGKLNVWVVYNTPVDMPELEERLKDLAKFGDFPTGRSLKILRVESSTSKAENLNHSLPLVTGKYVAVYDADHQPDPDSLMLLSQKLWNSKQELVCVQGSTQIRHQDQGNCLLGRIIDAEFFVMHFIYFPLLKELTNCTMFGGSNAVWDREVLLSLAFNQQVHTEDIDISVRALLDRGSIGICPEARSAELVPNSWKALYNQRLRWAIGWDQVSLKYFKEVNQLPWAQRAGLLHVLYMRWIVHLSGIMVGIAMPVIGIIWHFNPDTWGVSTIMVQMVLFSFYFLTATCALIEAIAEVNRRHGWLQVFFVAAFLALNSVYVMLNAVLVCISIFKLMTGHIGDWVVTTRDAPTVESKTASNTPTARNSMTTKQEPHCTSGIHGAEPEEEPSDH